jgi:hypothetical protein
MAWIVDRVERRRRRRSVVKNCMMGREPEQGRGRRECCRERTWEADEGELDIVLLSTPSKATV